MSTRFLEDNLDSLCMGCHSYFEDRKQTAYRDFKIERLGLPRVEEIEHLSRQLKRWQRWELTDLIQSYKGELEGV